MEDLSGRMLGEFILRKPIAEGGYAVVYRAEQPVLKRDVVVKVLRARRRRNDATLDRFLREARLASQLDHPYAAHVYAFGTDDDGLLWIAMELIHGVTLGAWLERHGPMSLEQFVPFFEHVAEVVHAAHERGIVHRDLKPSNVMVIECGGRLLPKLLDLGIAKLEREHEPCAPEPAAPPADADGAATAQIRPPRALRRTATDPDHGHKLTRTGVRMGSAPYMPPEQWDDAATVGPATDIYSLGILAYEALTGDRPFRAESTKDYYWRHLRAELPPLGDAFSPELDRILRRAVAKDPAARHASVRELAADLRALLNAQPREQIRSLAQVWDAHARSPALLLKSRDLLREQTGVVGDLERAFMSTSQRYASRRAHLRRFLAMSAGVLAMSAVWYRGKLETEMAERVAEASVTQSELEQGRSALLHGEPGAELHLARAYQRAPSPTTAFMLARALQPQLAEQTRLPSSFGRMWSAAFSPDGKQLVTSDDRNAQVWDAQSYRLLFTLPHGDTVYQAVYSSDGSKLVTACGDGAVRIWDPIHGQLVRELRPRDQAPRYYAVATSTDGKTVAAIDIAGAAAHVWDASAGTLIAELANKAAKFPSIAFSAGGRWLATSGGDDVRVFDTMTLSPARVISGPAIARLAWAPKGERLLTSTLKGEISLWDIPQNQRIYRFREMGEPVDAVAFSPDARLVVAASRDGAEQVWDATTGELKSQGNYLHGKIRSVEFDATGRFVLAAGAGGAAVADAIQGMPVSMLNGIRGMLMSAHFDPAAQRIVGAWWDGSATVWDARAPYLQWSSSRVADDCGVLMALEPDRRFVAIGCGEHLTRIWDTAHDKLLIEFPGAKSAGGDFPPASPVVSTAGDRAAIARGNLVEVYELPTGTLLHIIEHKAAVTALAFATTGRDLASGAADGSVRVTRDSGALIMFPVAAGGIDAVAFARDGRVVAADAHRQLRFFAPSGTTLGQVEVSARTARIRISDDSARLITLPRLSGRADSPELWSIEDYHKVGHLDVPGQGQVYAARFVPASRIVTASGDGSARLWDDATGQLLNTYAGGSRFLTEATLSGDGAIVIGGGGDGTLRFWDTSSGQLLWSMTAHTSAVIGIRVEDNLIVTRGFSGDISRWHLPMPDRSVEMLRNQQRNGTVLK